MRLIDKTTLLTTALALLMSTAFSAELEEVTPNPKGGVQVVPVDPTPDPNEVETRVLFPEEGEVKHSLPVKGQIRLEGIALGVNTEDSPRMREIWNDPDGQSLHVFIDNQPYFAISEAFIDSNDDIEDYFEQRADFEIPFKLQPGMHVIRVIPVRSYNESVKSNRAFTATTFYYKEKKGDPQVDLSAPYLTFNEPQGEYDYNKKNPEPILLDFFLTNCELSKDGYKLRLTIDNENQRTLISWQPYYIYGLKKGLHRVRLELLDPQNKKVPGIFNDVTRTIVVK